MAALLPELDEETKEEYWVELLRQQFLLTILGVYL